MAPSATPFAEGWPTPQALDEEGIAGVIDTDAWGGTAAARQRLALAVARRMREALPAGCVLGARITGTDWLPGGLDIEDAVSLAGQLRQAGVDYVCVTSGFVVRGARIPFGPGYL
ncbi:NADH:flavin oxidoreductase [Bordetella pertussis]|nr:NADH:flavin oxidoreductase [Bordetella pertussis]